MQKILPQDGCHSRQSDGALRRMPFCDGLSQMVLFDEDGSLTGAGIASSVVPAANPFLARSMTVILNKTWTLQAVSLLAFQFINIS